jgi:hypothetical protein
VLDGGARDGSFRLAGDARQIEALLERYLGGSSWLAVRAGNKK